MFQKVFREPSVLLPFLNEVLGNNLPDVDKLTNVEVLGEEQGIFSVVQYHILQDVRARNAKGNAYVIEIERACELYDVVQFQYTAARIFVELIDTRYETLRKNATEAAAAETDAAKEAAAKAAVEKAEAANAEAAEVEAAKAKAVKAVTPAKPKLVGFQDLFRPKDVPTVIVIVIVEKGLSEMKFSSKFTEKNQYTLVSSYDKFGNESKMNFIYIDLSRFAGTEKLQKPETPLDHWCSFLWDAKNETIEKEKLEKLKKFPGIREAIEMVGRVKTRVKMELEAKQNREETLREEGRFEVRLDRARQLLEKKWTMQ